MKAIAIKRINEAKADFVQIPKEEIMHKDLSLPDIEPISFRILNLAQNLFFYLSFKCGLLSDEHYEKCKSEEIDCKRNIECNLTVLTQLLEKINIKNVALFLNFVFDKIILENLIGARRLLTAKEKYEKEMELNEIIKKIIICTSSSAANNPNIAAADKEKFNFNKFKNNHLHAQETLLQSDPLCLTTILDDGKNSEILEKVNEKFPDLKFFKVKKALTRDLLLDKLGLMPNYATEFPVIHNFLAKEKSLEKLNNINKLNPFVNQMINSFSYKLSRKEAKLTDNTVLSCIEKISDSDAHKNELLKKFKLFVDAWREIYPNAVQFGCRRQMEPLPAIKLEDPIAYVLNDDGEYRYGMYLAAGY